MSVRVYAHTHTCIHAYAGTNIYKQIIKTLQHKHYKKDISEVLREITKEGLSNST